MPISRLRGLALLGLVALAGCDVGLFGAPAPEAIWVADNAVVVAGPQGYCVDQRLSRNWRDEAVVVLGSCAVLSRGATGPLGTPAVLLATVAVAPLAEPLSLQEMERFLRSPAGRAAISASNRAESVAIREVHRERGALFLVIDDNSPQQGGARMSQTRWRAVFVVRGRLVSASVLSFADRPLGRDAGLGLLSRFVARMRAANARAS